MKFRNLRPEALNKEFREKYKEVKEILEQISLPYTKGQPELKILIQDATKFLPLYIGRRILQKIRFDGKGLAEETFGAAIGSLFELECHFNQLIVLQQMQKTVDRLDPLMMELNTAYAEILTRCLNLTRMAFKQIGAYDQHQIYEKEIGAWLNSMNVVMQTMFGAPQSKADTESIQKVLS